MIVADIGKFLYNLIERFFCLKLIQVSTFILQCIEVALHRYKVSAKIASLHAETEFEKYRVIQDRLFMSDFDRYLLELEEQASKDKS